MTRVGCGSRPPDFGDIAGTLVELAAAERALRIHAELWQPDRSERSELVRALTARGFVPVAAPRMYTHTVLIDLARPEAELLASFSGTCRRHIRAPGKLGLAVDTISDERFAGRLEELDAETMSRTGGQVRPIDWPGMLRFVRDEPTFATLIGISRPNSAAARDLLGFVLGVRHSDTVEYFRAASSRPADLKAPLLYAPAWEVMRWGQRLGARCFDFGGISSSPLGAGDARGGIDDFKHGFGADDVELGGELTYSPSAMLDGVARSASGLRAAFRGR